MSKAALNMFLAIAFILGFMVGLFVMAFDMTEKQAKNISYTELEKQLDKSYCETRILEAIIAERIRLTGRPNPLPSELP